MFKNMYLNIVRLFLISRYLITYYVQLVHFIHHRPLLRKNATGIKIGIENIKPNVGAKFTYLD